MTFKINDRVVIVNTNTSEVENRTGSIIGLSVDGIVKIWIVLLDYTLTDGTRGVTVPEGCLKYAASGPTVPVDQIKIPPNTYTFPEIPNTGSPIGTCAKCGRTYRQIDMYVCMDYACPMQKITWL